MDRSLDSIGSCSLDVDADSSDISDTSGSLNFPTPLSIKDITREFTENIRERCTVVERPSVVQNSTAYVLPATGKVCMVLTEPSTGGGGGGGGGAAGSGVVGVGSKKSADAFYDRSPSESEVVDVSSYDKKPSYLNLACCVNGYSNLTTYDSKIRQDINKSREVSPIRPSTSSIQYCKKNNSLAAPVLHTMPNAGVNGTPPLTKQPSPARKYIVIESNNNNNNASHGHIYQNGSASELYNGSGEVDHGITATTSFIKQRVERLYGPGALAQGFYSPKKYLSPRSTKCNILDVENQQSSSELARKFKQLSPSKDYSEFRKKLDLNASSSATARQTDNSSATGSGTSNEEIDLPVFRHLSQEFRAQLPSAVSPKRNILRVSPNGESDSTNGIIKECTSAGDVVDHKVPFVPGTDSEYYLTTTKVLAAPAIEENSLVSRAAGDADVKDGNYFLIILKNEQTRLLALAAVAEKYIDALSNNPEITEDTLGFLRAASGKARLLVSQKMKQFEGLCHNNLNRSPEDKFPTTLDDLQGFWDMVNLQVDHVDSIFEDIEKLKNNDWKIINEPDKQINASKSQKSLKTGNCKSKTNFAAPNGSKASDAVKSAAAIKREAQRKQLMEMKRKHREARAAANNAAASELQAAETTGDILIVTGGNSS